MMSEVYVPPEAVADAIAALRSIYSDDPAANNRRELQWPGEIWKLAVRRALALHPVRDGQFVRRPRFELAITYFRDLETKHVGAMLTSEWECLGVEDRAYLKKVEADTLDPSTRSIWRARAIDAAAEGL